MNIEQIAFTTPDPEPMQMLFNAIFGTHSADWVEDQATGAAWIYGRLVRELQANLLFCERPVQFEILSYPNRDGWVNHRGGRRIECSHLAYHVADAVAEAHRLGFPLAQVVVTYRHTNQFLVDQARSYIYIVLDSIEELGFDTKLIQRVQGVPTAEEAYSTLLSLVAKLENEL